jgi:DNA-binding CsgD family transcriptional regulator
MMVLQITPSERGLLECLADGVALTEIARRFGSNEHQIDMSLQALFTRMGVTSRAEAVASALRRGLLAAGSIATAARPAGSADPVREQGNPLRTGA